MFYRKFIKILAWTWFLITAAILFFVAPSVIILYFNITNLFVVFGIFAAFITFNFGGFIAFARILQFTDKWNYEDALKRLVEEETQREDE